LQEKYDRGQKDFTREQYENLEDFIKEELEWKFTKLYYI
jgi:hypothetical protein